MVVSTRRGAVRWDRRISERDSGGVEARGGKRWGESGDGGSGGSSGKGEGGELSISGG